MHDARPDVGQHDQFDRAVRQSPCVVPTVIRELLNHKHSACNLFLYGFRGVGGNLRRIALDLTDGACDFVHILLVAKQGKLRKPHGFPGSAQGIRKLLWRY